MSGKRRTHATVQGQVYYQPPGNNLPDWVRDQAAIRGYGDAKSPLSWLITEDDVDRAIAARAKGDGAQCVLAQSALRIGVAHAYFYRTFVWVDLGTGPLLRYQVPVHLMKQVIIPFDEGKPKSAIPRGLYTLQPPRPSVRLGVLRGRGRRGKSSQVRGTNKRKPVQHLDRMINASKITS